MNNTRAIVFTTALATMLNGCVSTPMGPTIPVMPGPDKSLQAFQGDESTCEGYASQCCCWRRAANNTAIGDDLG